MSNVLDALLNGTVDDLADLPEIKPFPAGAHRVTVEFETKEINKKPAVFLHMTLVEHLELADTNDEPLVAGAKTNCMYMLLNNDGKPNEISQGQLKKILLSVKEGLGVSSSSPGDIMEAAKGAEVVVSTKLRENKSNGTFNTQVIELMFG